MTNRIKQIIVVVLMLTAPFLLTLIPIVQPIEWLDHEKIRVSMISFIFNFWTAGMLMGILMKLLNKLPQTVGLLYSIPSFVIVGVWGSVVRGEIEQGTAILSLFATNFPYKNYFVDALRGKTDNITAIFSILRPYIGAISEIVMGMLIVAIMFVISHTIKNKLNKTESSNKIEWFKPSYVKWIALPFVLGFLDFFISYWFAFVTRVRRNVQTPLIMKLCSVAFFFIAAAVVFYFLADTIGKSDLTNYNLLYITSSVIPIVLLVVWFLAYYFKWWNLPVFYYLNEKTMSFPFVFLTAYGAVLGILLSCIQFKKSKP